MQNNPPSSLSPGHHLFTSPQKGLTFEYIIHHPDDDTTNSSDLDLLIIHCPAWGLGSTYLQAGLQALTTTSATSATTRRKRALLFLHPRGTNNSTFPSDPTKMSSMPDLASDLEDLRLHLGLETFPCLLGHSNGGAIILGYAEMFPTRVEKLILLNHSLIGFKDKRVLDESESVARDERYKDAFRVSSVLSNPRTDDEFTEMVSCIWPLYFFDTGFVERLVKDIGEGNMSIDCWRSVYGCDKALEKSRQMIDGLEKVQAKTLILYGEDDLICGPGVAKRTKEGIRDALLLGYDRCGHFPWIEKREQTLDDIRSFLDTGTVNSNMCI